MAQELQPLDRQVRPLRPVPPPSSLPHGPDPRYTDRYLYVPIGGATHAAWATLVVFTFVALWHDLSLKLLTWGWVISLFVLPEMAARKFVSYEEVRPGPPPSFPLFPSPAPLKYEEGKHARLTSASFYFVFGGAVRCPPMVPPPRSVRRRPQRPHDDDSQPHRVRDRDRGDVVHVGPDDWELGRSVLPFSLLFGTTS